MAEKSDYDRLKKKYGEDFAKFCRSYFSHEMNTSDAVYRHISSKFPPSRFLYNDIVNAGLEGEFQGFIAGLIESEKGVEEKAVDDGPVKTPEELLAERGYTIKESQSHEENLTYKNYFTEPGGEHHAICTLEDPDRVKANRIFWIVKDGAKNIQPRSMEDREKEDEYGSSVMTVQFDRLTNRLIKITNRYNHAGTRDADGTFHRNLDEFIPGLAKSFETHYGLQKHFGDASTFHMPNYIMANDGKYHKYNKKIFSSDDKTYVCPGGTIISDGEVMKLDPSRYELIDGFVVDTKDKKIEAVGDKEQNDGFITAHQDIQKIDIVKRNDGSEVKDMIITNGDGSVSNIGIDKFGRIQSFANDQMTIVPDNFMSECMRVESFSVPNATEIGKGCLQSACYLEEINAPNVKKIGDNSFVEPDIRSEDDLKLDSVEEIGDGCFTDCNMESLNLPNCRKVGEGFMERNELKDIHMPKLEDVGDYAFNHSPNLENMFTPNLEQMGEGSFKNCAPKKAYAPKIEPKSVDNYVLRKRLIRNKKRDNIRNFVRTLFKGKGTPQKQTTQEIDQGLERE